MYTYTCITAQTYTNSYTCHIPIHKKFRLPSQLAVFLTFGLGASPLIPEPSLQPSNLLFVVVVVVHMCKSEVNVLCHCSDDVTLFEKGLSLEPGSDRLG